MDYLTSSPNSEFPPSAAEQLLASDPRAEISEARLEALSGVVFERIHTFDAGLTTSAVSAAWQKTEKVEYSHHLFRFGSGKDGVYSGVKLRGWVGYAAAAVILGVFGIKYIPNIIPTPQSTSVAKTYTTAPAQRATITLASGAQVTLAPATTLRVQGNEVVLSGQAVFTVLHKSKSPFVVKTDNATVRVLGTTFNVRAYKDDRSTKVVVAEGKVATNNTVLTTGDASETSSSGTTVQHGIDISSALAWTSGRLSFNEIQFSRAIPDIERWYDVKIKTSGTSLYERRITTSLRSDSIREAIELLSAALNARVEQHGNTITFFPND